jgi:hypothetical protein
VFAGFELMAAVAGKAGDLPAVPEQASTPVVAASTTDSAVLVPQGNTTAVGATVMTKYVVALEIGGVLLLISMVGAIALARKQVPSEGHVPPAKPIGQVGKEVRPY